MLGSPSASRRSAISSAPAREQSAAVSVNDRLNTPEDYAGIIVKAENEPSDVLADELKQHVAKVISPIARPKYLLIVPDLPKTRSGKIMRRLLLDIADGRPLGDTTTLADAGVVETIRENSWTAEE